jgi:hypothetical protein
MGDVDGIYLWGTSLVRGSLDGEAFWVRSGQKKVPKCFLGKKEVQDRSFFPKQHLGTFF